MNYTDPNLQHAAIDLTNCDREPIHIPGRVQAFGALVGFSADLIVTHASRNLPEVAGTDLGDVIGTPLGSILSEPAVQALRGRVQMLGDPDAQERIFGIDLFGNGQLFDAALHASNRTFVLEMEPASAGQPTDYIGFVRPMIDRVQRAPSLENACQMAARQLRALVGYDRVMVYRFDEDYSGEVVAESRAAHIKTSYQNLRYPASDIPRQARALYLRNLLRIIADTDGPTVPIDPPLTAKSLPLDLSLSTIRAVSPVHLEYLANMGVRATLTISIIVRGKLWGMLSCHHYAPRVIPFDMRTAAELFGQLFGFAIDQMRGDSRREEMVRARIVHDQIMASLADGTTINDNFETIADAVATVIPYDGVAAWVDGVFTARGPTPTREEFLGLSRYLNTTPVGEVFAIDHIQAVYPKGDAFVDRAAGMLALPVSRKPRDYLVLFRREAVREVNWAGNPDKPVEVGPNGVRLQPRKSFEAWAETVHGRSLPWTDGQVGAAESLRMTLLEVVLRMTDQAVMERARAQEQQELLIAELNHRVRNILKLIQGLVAQSSSAADVTSFTETVGGRIHALARAHDQITRENWNPASLRELIATEAEAYLAGKSDRVVIHGPDAMLTPAAFTTVSLVMHELLTNAMKYGSLIDSSGRVTIETAETETGDLRIRWQEEGGPAVTAPSRRGFGTTIIERSIPFELKGGAEVSYDVTGVRANFVIPVDHIDCFRAPQASVAQATPKATGMRLSGKAMILEDNLIIALDAEDMLRDLGAEEVVVHADVASAMAALEMESPGFALLDVNLGTETSIPVARALTERGVPFAFATGYGDRTAYREAFPDAPILQKPYDVAAMADALAKLKSG